MSSIDLEFQYIGLVSQYINLSQNIDLVSQYWLNISLYCSVSQYIDLSQNIDLVSKYIDLSQNIDLVSQYIDLVTQNIDKESQTNKNI